MDIIECCTKDASFTPDHCTNKYGRYRFDSHDATSPSETSRQVGWQKLLPRKARNSRTSLTTTRVKRSIAEGSSRRSTANVFPHWQRELLRRTSCSFHLHQTSGSTFAVHSQTYELFASETLRVCKLGSPRKGARR